MREIKPFSDRTRLHSSDAPKRKYLLVFEGKDTEPRYFDMIDRRKTELDINSLVELSRIIRNFPEEGWSHPKKIAEAIIKTLKIQSSGKYPYKNVLVWIADYLYSNKFLTINYKIIFEELQELCVKELDLVLEETIDYNNLNATIENILNNYIQKRNALGVEDLAECAKAIIEDNNIVYDSEFDTLCLIVDRDQHSFKNEQYDHVVKYCNENQIKLFVSNPCFEFWLLLHFDDVTDISQVDLKENKKDKKHNGHTFAERELKKRLPGYTKSSYNAYMLFHKIPVAIENEKKYCEDILGLKTEVGSNIGILLSEMRSTNS